MVGVDLETLVLSLVVRWVHLVPVVVVERLSISVEESSLHRLAVNHLLISAGHQVGCISVARLLSDHSRLEQVSLLDVGRSSGGSGLGSFGHQILLKVDRHSVEISRL